MAFDPKTGLALLVAEQLGSDSAAVVEKDGEMYFHNAKAAANAMVMIKSAHRGEYIELKEENRYESETGLGAKWGVNNNNLGFFHKAVKEHSVQMKAKFYEVTDADRYYELVKFATANKIPLDVIERGFAAATKMITSGEVGLARDMELPPPTVKTKVLGN